MISKAGDKSLLIEMEIKAWGLPNLQPNKEESFVSLERRAVIPKADSQRMGSCWAGANNTIPGEWSKAEPGVMKQFRSSLRFCSW